MLKTPLATDVAPLSNMIAFGDLSTADELEGHDNAKRVWFDVAESKPKGLRVFQVLDPVSDSAIFSNKVW